MSTPVSLKSQAVALWLAFFDAGTNARLGKTATAANKTSVTSVPRTLSFDIFISLKKLARMAAGDASTVLDPAPRVGGNQAALDIACFLVGIPTKPRHPAMYQSG